jgi:tripartite-type tricarboxylate transporter receptor subunit TctC
MRFNRQVLLLAAVVWAAMVPLSALGQDYPSRPLRWLVGYPAGGGSDILTRVVAEAMSKELGQPVVVENRAGATGKLAAEALVQAPADGYTLLLGDRGVLILGPASLKDVGFRLDAFAPVGQIAYTTMVFAVGAGVPVRSLREFVALAKSKPKELSYASPGPGTQQELTFEIFRQQASIEVNQIRYKGGSQPVMDVTQGRVSSIVAAYPQLVPFLKAGTLRPLAVAQGTRMDQLAEVPTFLESGIKNLDSPLWNGLFVKAGTPPQIMERLSTALGRALGSQEVASRVAATGWSLKPGTAKEVSALIESDLRIWPPVIKQLGE